MLFTGLGLALVVLIVIAALQRRPEPTLAMNTSPDRAATALMSPTQPTYTPSPRAQPQLTSLGVAIGVWLGLWLFVLSAAIPAAIYLNSYANR